MSSRKISASRKSSRCSSVERSMENIPEEVDEKPFRGLPINKQEVLAEEDSNSDSDEKNDISTMGRKISRETQQNGTMSRGDSRKMSEINIDSKLPSRKPSAANSASSSNCPSRNWSRHSSPTRGEILRMEDEMHTVNRGRSEITLYSKTS